MNTLRFTLPNGKTIDGKKDFKKSVKITHRTLMKLILSTKYDVNSKDQKEHLFTFLGKEYKFILINKGVKNPNYTRNLHGNFRGKLENSFKVFKESENHVFEYSCNSGQLIMTFTKERFEQILNKFFMFVDARYQV